MCLIYIYFSWDYPRVHPPPPANISHQTHFYHDIISLFRIDGRYTVTLAPQKVATFSSVHQKESDKLHKTSRGEDGMYIAQKRSLGMPPLTPGPPKNTHKKHTQTIPCVLLAEAELRTRKSWCVRRMTVLSPGI